MRVMLDSHIHDLIVGNPALREVVDTAQAAGKLTLVSTHVQHDELSRISDEQKRDAVLGIPVESQPTKGIVWGVSSWKGAHWGDKADGQIINHIMKGKLADAEDALIAATAAKTADVLVTNDGRLRKRIRSSGSPLRVWTSEEFASWLQSLA